jgi:hypothetical protein
MRVVAAVKRMTARQRSIAGWIASALLTPAALFGAGKLAFAWLDARYVHADAYRLRIHDDSIEHVYDDLRAYAVRQAVDSMKHARKVRP